jgi:aspartyl-tRNA(Asn)/glutamyl-tRNA(Gln) amidotransferase subunit B
MSGQILEYEAVIGLEVHAQLRTKSKMFCSCSAAYQELQPNTDVCPVCMGMPGVLPVPNRKAVEYVVRTGLALGCTIADVSKFDRKNYPYPDLMKGYQISQFDRPIASNGHLDVETEAGARTIRVERVHLEEDVSKLMHRSDGTGSYSLLDINRAGVPLMEVVSHPDMRSADEARDYLTKLRSIFRYIGVSTANMEEGSFRCDANISIRPVGDEELGPKVEVKNMNSFRGVHGALLYEIERQNKAVRVGERIVQETRGWADEKGTTFSQRSKEEANDYRYFSEPDIPPFAISRTWVEEVGSSLPELPVARKLRYESDYGLSPYDAGLLTGSRDLADYFEKALGDGTGSQGERAKAAKSVSNWLLGEFTRLLSESDTAVTETKVQPGQILKLQALVDGGTLSSSMAKTVFIDMFETGRPAAESASALGMEQISDTSAVQAAVDEAIAANSKAVADYRAGKDSAVKFLVGQVMRVTRGKANPKLATELVRKRLDSGPDA